MRMMIKYWLFLLMLAVGTAPLHAQLTNEMESEEDIDARLERVQAQRIAYITNRLQLSPTEAAKFWPLFNEYERERRQMRRQRSAKPVAELSEAEARRLIEDELERETRLLALRKRYYEQFLRVLPARKIALLPVADREFKRDLLQQLRRRRQ